MGWRACIYFWSFKYACKVVMSVGISDVANQNKPKKVTNREEKQNQSFLLLAMSTLTFLGKKTQGRVHLLGIRVIRVLIYESVLKLEPV